MTTVNNEIAITSSDIQSAMLICSRFLGKRSDDSELCRIVFPARELGLPASIFGHLCRNNRLVQPLTTMLTEPPPTRLPFRDGPSGASVQHFVQVSRCRGRGVGCVKSYRNRFAFGNGEWSICLSLGRRWMLRLWFLTERLSHGTFSQRLSKQRWESECPTSED